MEKNKIKEGTIVKVVKLDRKDAFYSSGAENDIIGKCFTVQAHDGLGSQLGPAKDETYDKALEAHFKSEKEACIFLFKPTLEIKN